MITGFPPVVKETLPLSAPGSSVARRVSPVGAACPLGVPPRPVRPPAAASPPLRALSSLRGQCGQRRAPTRGQAASIRPSQGVRGVGPPRRRVGGFCAHSTAQSVPPVASAGSLDPEGRSSAPLGIQSHGRFCLRPPPFALPGAGTACAVSPAGGAPGSRRTSRCVESSGRPPGTV